MNAFWKRTAGIVSILMWWATLGMAESGPVVLAGAPIRSGCEPDYPPYCIVAEDGHADGFSVELLRASLQAVGREVEFKTAPWAEIKQDLADGRLQALPLMGRTPEREAQYDYTFPYLTMHGTLVVRGDNADIRVPRDLAGKRVAVMQGDNAEEYLQRSGLGAEIVPRPSFEMALRELSEGQHDAVVVQKLVAFQLMQQAGLENLQTVGPPIFPQHFCFAVREGDRDLLAMLNEGLSIVMANGVFRELHTKWFSGIEAVGRGKSRIVVGGDRNYPPYEFLDKNGQPAGLNVDITRAIARRMGLSVDFRLGEWSVIRKGLENGEIDALQGLFYSIERDKLFDFSLPSSIVQHAIVVRTGSPELLTMQDLAGKSILVQAGDILDDLAREFGYGKQLVAVESQEEALRRLAAGQADCALVAKLPALFWIEKHGWRNLNVSALSVLSSEYCYAVPSGHQELLAQFSDGLAAIKATGEHRQIQAKWLTPYESVGFRKVAQIALWAILPLLFLLLLSLLWSRSLQRVVARRTRELSFNVALLNARSEASLDGILVVDDHGKVLSYNRRFVEMWKMTPDLLQPEDDRHLLQYAVRQMANPQSFLDRVTYLYEHRQEIDREEIALKDGRVFDRYTAPIFGAEGSYYGRVWYFRDISDKRQAEEARSKLQTQLIQAQKMESMGRLAGGVAHDFNNMLQAILGHAELALDQLPPDSPLQEDIHEIQAAAQRSSDLTRQLLAFARKQSVVPKVLDLNATVEGMLKMLRRLIGEDIDLVWLPGTSVWPVKMDPSQVDQILANLCVNARDAIEGVGKVTIETGTKTFDKAYCEEHSGAIPGEYVRLSVFDSGCGMDKETLSNIFEPFFTTKGPGEGTGLGLATVYGAVKQNNGNVFVESEPGNGTVFHIYLPRHLDEMPSPPTSAFEETLVKGKGTILLVEDETSILRIATAMLEKLGYRVFPASTPGEAIEMAKAHAREIDLLMTDVVMPEMNGRDLTNMIVFLCPGIKRLFMSGYTADVIAHHGVLDDGVCFLQKPFTIRDLATKVGEAMASS